MSDARLAIVSRVPNYRFVVYVPATTQSEVGRRLKRVIVPRLSAGQRLLATWETAVGTVSDSDFEGRLVATFGRGVRPSPRVRGSIAVTDSDAILRVWVSTDLLVNIFAIPAVLAVISTLVHVSNVPAMIVSTAAVVVGAVIAIASHLVDGARAEDLISRGVRAGDNAA